jgi:hypothetical protein
MRGRPTTKSYNFGERSGRQGARHGRLDRALTVPMTPMDCADWARPSCVPACDHVVAVVVPERNLMSPSLGLDQVLGVSPCPRPTG